MELTDVITVYSEKTPNPESMKFVANKMILPNDSIDFRVKEGLDECPMAKELFEYDFVKGVFIMNNFVSVTKKADYEWFDIIPQLKKFVQEYLEAEKPIVVTATAAAAKRDLLIKFVFILILLNFSKGCVGILRGADPSHWGKSAGAKSENRGRPFKFC